VSVALLLGIGITLIAGLAAILAWLGFGDRAILTTPAVRGICVVVGTLIVVTGLGGYRPFGVSLVSFGLSAVAAWTNGVLAGSAIATPISLVMVYTCLLGMIGGLGVAVDREFRAGTSAASNILDRWPYSKPILLGFGSAGAAIVGLIYTSQAVDEFSASFQVALISSVFVGVTGFVRTDRAVARR
jgi:hypothetical protein